MKKLVAILFLISFLIFGFGFLFPEQLGDIVNSIFPGYYEIIINGIWIVTGILAIVFTIILLTDRRKDQIGTTTK